MNISVNVQQLNHQIVKNNFSIHFDQCFATSGTRVIPEDT